MLTGKRASGTSLGQDNKVGPRRKIAMSLVKAYLMAYNLAQLLGWSWIMWLAAPHFWQTAKSGMAVSDAMFGDIGAPLTFFQVGMLMEVLHNVVGIVRGTPAITMAQVGSRVLVVFFLRAFPDARTSLGFPAIAFAWSLTEVVRYSYYLTALADVKVGALTWLRYSLFLALYPMGIAGEWFILKACLPALALIRWVALPNALNFTLSPHTLTLVVMAVYIPASPVLIGHMLNQRKKVLGGVPAQEKDSTKPKAN